MTRYAFTLRTETDRARVCRYVQAAPLRTRVELKAEKRTIPQNARLWALLTDVSEQVGWHGRKLRPEDWKTLFMDALQREALVVPSLDGWGAVSLGYRSSDLSVSEMGELMDLIEAWGAQNGVVFNEPKENAA